MGVSKIKELPVKSKAQVEDTDIMVIEDTYDTKQITVRDLKLVFSADEKLNAMKLYFSNQIDEFTENITKISDSLIQDSSELSAKYLNLYNDLEAVKRKLGELQEQLISLDNRTTDLEKRADTNDVDIKNIKNRLAEDLKNINSLLADNKTNIQNINLLLSDNENNKTRLTNLEKSDEEINKRITDEISRLEDSIQNTSSNATEYSDKLYNDIIKYIDYYHHIHDYPPNFDDPSADENSGGGDAVYLPVGSIYSTSISTFNPNDILKGTWESKGQSTITLDDGSTIVQYIYLRIK